MSRVAPHKPPVQRDKPFDDVEYREYLHGHPCRRCGATTGCQAAHLGHARGTGYKESADQCVALCPACHLEFDTAAEGKGEWWVREVTIPEERRKYKRWMHGL
jgi:hypothetical protein